MATIISVKVGAAAAVTVSYADDTQAAAYLNATYDGFGLGPANATNAEKIRACIRHWIVSDVRQLRQAHIADEAGQQTRITEAQSLFELAES